MLPSAGFYQPLCSWTLKNNRYIIYTNEGIASDSLLTVFSLIWYLGELVSKYLAALWFWSWKVVYIIKLARNSPQLISVSSGCPGSIDNKQRMSQMWVMLRMIGRDHSKMWRMRGSPLEKLCDDRWIVFMFL